METVKKRVVSWHESNIPNIKPGDIVETVTLTEDNYKDFAADYWREYEVVDAKKCADNSENIAVMSKWKKHSLAEWCFGFVTIGATYVKADNDPLNPSRGKGWYKIVSKRNILADIS